MSKFLIVGDSQSVWSGTFAERRLFSKGHTVRRISNPGMGPHDYVRISSLWNSYVSAVRNFAPDLILLIFGSNDSPNEKLRESLSTLKTSVKPKVFLSGPPQYEEEKQQEKGQALRKMYGEVFGEDYFDSYPYTSLDLPRASDKIHLTPMGARAWGEALAAFLALKSSENC